MQEPDQIASDLTAAIVLAGVQHEATLAQFDEGPKRKSRWSECQVSKKGKRWGQQDDKPYKPLPYVDLPIGLKEKEIDQFLREQRLEDLHRKIQAHDLEDFDADIRPPSPPPVYDKSGNRLNTRDVRIRKAMTAEYNRLIRFMIKTVDGYLPPVDWKPAKLLKKIIIPIEKFPQAPFMGVVIGPRGVNHKRLQDSTGCKIFIRGRDIGDKWQSDEEAGMPQHVHIEGDTEEQILACEKLVVPLLNPETPEFEYARTHGMQQLALVNGFTLNKAEQRCGICGALGHLGFECPETNNQNYKMANVVCTICGDKGHVASDCKKAAEQNQRENVDWKTMAEKKQNMNMDFDKMMQEMGVNENMQNLEKAGAQAAAQAQAAAPAAAPQMRPPFGPRPGMGPMPGGMPNAMGPRPGMITPNMMGGGMGGARPPQMTPPTGGPMGGQPGQNMFPPGMASGSTLGSGGMGVDRSIIIPQNLVGKLIGPGGGNIKQMALDTGAQINMDTSVHHSGGKAIVITAADAGVRERAKARVKSWLESNPEYHLGAPMNNPGMGGMIPGGKGMGPMGQNPMGQQPMGGQQQMGMRPPMQPGMNPAGNNPMMQNNMRPMGGGMMPQRPQMQPGMQPGMQGAMQPGMQQGKGGMMPGSNPGMMNNPPGLGGNPGMGGQGMMPNNPPLNMQPPGMMPNNPPNMQPPNMQPPNMQPPNMGPLGSNSAGASAMPVRPSMGPGSAPGGNIGGMGSGMPNMGPGKGGMQLNMGLGGGSMPGLGMGPNMGGGAMPSNMGGQLNSMGQPDLGAPGQFNQQSNLGGGAPPSGMPNMAGMGMGGGLGNLNLGGVKPGSILSSLGAPTMGAPAPMGGQPNMGAPQNMPMPQGMGMSMPPGLDPQGMPSQQSNAGGMAGLPPIPPISTDFFSAPPPMSADEQRRRIEELERQLAPPKQISAEELQRREDEFQRQMGGGPPQDAPPPLPPMGAAPPLPPGA